MSEPSTAKSRWSRVVWDLFHPFTSRVVEEDGLKPKNRTGLQDFWHAVKNLWAHTPAKPEDKPSE